MLILENVKLIEGKDTGKTFDINLDGVDAISDYFPLVNNGKSQVRSAEADKKSCVLLMRGGAVFPIAKSRASVLQQMKNYRG